MPLGFERLHAKRTQPNPHIVFIKPLKGPDEATAQEFLERIAAQCVPIMKEHSISVMSLEEYEPNAEFVGRNFNAGEVIQLVLKARFTGRWLPFEYVQMVMMHELAHCKQMNHSRAFWAVRNQYADDMRKLWARSYTGEGLWGRGLNLGSGKFENNTVLPDEPLPEHLCGGTYQSRRRKRKARPELSYKERKERRILKKFGANGIALGQDDEVKAELEKGKRTAAKPRVAGSKRGRELRAAAALARFDQQKKDDTAEEEVKQDGSDTESDGDYEDSQSEHLEPDALDIDGKALRDTKGRGMVKVCEDENPDDLEAQRELAELKSSLGRNNKAVEITEAQPPESQDRDKKPNFRETDATVSGLTPIRSRNRPPAPTAKLGNPTSASKTASSPIPNRGGPADNGGKACSICSFANGAGVITCAICSHVLEPENHNDTWRCQSDACAGSLYVNAGDCGVCGVCGRRRV